MILALALALGAAQPLPTEVRAQLDEAAHALSMGRTIQARAMLAEAVRQGARGEPLDRLMADLDFAEGKHERALAYYRQLLAANPDDAILIERAAISALELDKETEARALLSRLSIAQATRWTTLNAMGVMADRDGRYEVAREAYAAGLAMAPEEPKLLNNLGWSLLLQGQWADALVPLEAAARLAPENPKILANRDLARMAMSAELPVRRPGENGANYAARLNDAGVVAAAQGDKPKAVAAFTRALEASSRWYKRAADNLARIGGKK
ncbi:tetratricopeptide repeat protein [Sphingomicrobium nitratireducens]|uniref:tetratricopeptide repeat protein n=1 Tax=Sphingomicrobium nitratireducens TaxID=2964666 RepID=UPI00223FE5F4|nr:tetratricopeptide repeat protein [Sphingomicrobium nitratireducens]